MINVNVETSARHVHLSPADYEKLFGIDAKLNKVRELSVIGEFLSDKSVTIIGTKRSIENVSVLGPLRQQTQVEISRTDTFYLGEKNVPLRLSGELDDTNPIKLQGTNGTVELTEGLIVAKRHLHIPEGYGVADGDIVTLKTEGERSTAYNNVVVRISNILVPTVHLDTDEGNAVGGITAGVCEKQSSAV
jgi:putative phosphotransacetylase